MLIDELRKRVLSEVRRKKIERRESGISGSVLKKGKRGEKRARGKRRIEERVNDGSRLRNRRDESGGAVSLGGSKTGSTEFDRKRRLTSRILIQRLTNQQTKRGILEVVESLVGRKKKGGVACSKTVGELWEGETEAEKVEGDMRVIEGG